MFSGVKAVILCKIYGFSKKSGEIIKKRIEENGGEAILYEKLEENSCFTHLIVPESMPSDDLAKLTSSVASNFHIVTPEWASSSLASSCVQKESDYSPTPVALKRLPPGSVSASKELKTSPKKSPLTMDFSRIRTANLNAHLTEELEKIESYFHATGDKGRSISYSNVIRTLKLLPFTVTDISQLQDIKGFGEKILKKIKEILATGKSGKIDNLVKDPRYKAMEVLTSVHGIGINTARNLYKKGICDIDQLKEHASKSPGGLSQMQLDSIKMYDDFQVKIKRNEVEFIGEIVKEHLLKIDNQALFEICGSYRRGRVLCGDIDIVIGLHRDEVLSELVFRLENCGLVTCSFTKSVHKYMGVVKLPGKPHRRFDIYAVTPDAFYFAVLYFTGSKNYNRMIRQEANKKGYHLSNSGLYDLRTGESVMSPNCEDDIIRFLGFPVLTLRQRDI